MYFSSTPRRLCAFALLTLLISSVCGIEVRAQQRTLICPGDWVNRGKWLCVCPDGSIARGSDNDVMRCAVEGTQYQPTAPSYPPASDPYAPGFVQGPQYQATAPPALAQQHYTFEEACRRAGMTTGACAPKSQQPQTTICTHFGRNAFHAEAYAGAGCTQVTLSPVLDAELFIEMVGIPNASKINELGLTIGRSTGLKNAAAFFHDDGSRWMTYDPDWARAATAEAYLVLGHEAGHHFCGHTLATVKIDPKQRELEADRFSGASIKRFEVYHGKPFLDGALKAAERLYSQDGSRSHPPRAARLEAVLLGYKTGSQCGNLAPAIRGYSPQAR
jgi:hypothetical protein